MRMTIHSYTQEGHSILWPNNISYLGIRYGSSFNEIKSTYTYNLKSDFPNVLSVLSHTMQKGFKKLRMTKKFPDQSPLLYFVLNM